MKFSLLLTAAVVARGAPEIVPQVGNRGGFAPAARAPVFLTNGIPIQGMGSEIKIWNARTGELVRSIVPSPYGDPHRASLARGKTSHGHLGPVTPPEWVVHTPLGYYTGSAWAEHWLRWRVGEGSCAAQANAQAGTRPSGV